MEEIPSSLLWKVKARPGEKSTFLRTFKETNNFLLFFEGTHYYIDIIV